MKAKHLTLVEVPDKHVAILSKKEEKVFPQQPVLCRIPAYPTVSRNLQKDVFGPLCGGLPTLHLRNQQRGTYPYGDINVMFGILSAYKNLMTIKKVQHDITIDFRMAITADKHLRMHDIVFVANHLCWY